MNKNAKNLDIYLMGIGGTGMGAMAGLLKKSGHRVRGSDSAVYSPMKEKLADWGISYQTPYSPANLEPKSDYSPTEQTPDSASDYKQEARPDLVIVGNVIRRDNPEAQAMRELNLNYESFPSALKHMFLSDRVSLVAAGTHGKTTCSALLAHCLQTAGLNPGFLIGGIPINLGESFAVGQSQGPFVVEGDEYDTAYFDKRPKFVHYEPKFLLLTSLEYDHADIYPDLDSIISVFVNLLNSLDNTRIIILNNQDSNLKLAWERSHTQARVLTYGLNEGSDLRPKFWARDINLGPNGCIYTVMYEEQVLGTIQIPLYGEHNLANSLGCYAVLHSYGLSHEQICAGFKSFKGVKRRLEEIYSQDSLIIVDDFAHHPSAVRETIKAARQKYPDKKLWAIFEPRSATSCLKIFESDYERAFGACDRVIFAPIGRKLDPDLSIDTHKMAQNMRDCGLDSLACSSYEELRYELRALMKADPSIKSTKSLKAELSPGSGHVLLFMSNGDFSGLLKNIAQILT